MLCFLFQFGLQQRNVKLTFTLLTHFTYFLQPGAMGVPKGRGRVKRFLIGERRFTVLANQR